MKRAASNSSANFLEVKKSKAEEGAAETPPIPVLDALTETVPVIDTLAAPISDTSTPTYVLDETFRRVQPYWFNYSTWAKGRWFRRRLDDVFQREFRDRPAAYYAAACRAGLIRINNERVETDYVIKQGDLVQHRIHRHEPPVLRQPEPAVLSVQDGFIVVNKPPSVPMHPSGRYRHNSLTSILQHQRPELFPSGHVSCVNRLDRLVSGIVILATSALKADELRRAMEDRLFRKFYLARVQGRFVPGDIAALGLHYASTSESGVIECRAPLLVVEHKMGVSCVADGEKFPAAKASVTRFVALGYDAESDSSMVLAEPVTGRTHQIRIHLQYLGLPIRNDPLYNNSFWRSLQRDTGPGEAYMSDDWIVRVQEMTGRMAKSPHFQLEDGEALDYGEMESTSTVDICPDCAHPRGDPDVAALGIDLHAYKYSGPMGTFSTPPPVWSQNSTDAALAAAEEMLSEAKREAVSAGEAKREAVSAGEAKRETVSAGEALQSIE